MEGVRIQGEERKGDPLCDERLPELYVGPQCTELTHTHAHQQHE